MKLEQRKKNGKTNNFTTCGWHEIHTTWQSRWEKKILNMQTSWKKVLTRQQWLYRYVCAGNIKVCEGKSNVCLIITKLKKRNLCTSALEEKFICFFTFMYARKSEKIYRLQSATIATTNFERTITTIFKKNKTKLS